MQSQPSLVLHRPQQAELGAARDRGMNVVVRKADIYLLGEAVWVCGTLCGCFRESGKRFQPALTDSDCTKCVFGSITEGKIVPQ